MRLHVNYRINVQLEKHKISSLTFISFWGEITWRMMGDDARKYLRLKHCKVCRLYIDSVGSNVDQVS